ncbi:hypothetical protein CRM22_009172 [Opisthorchis felineus]|uniref:MalT-like TPR region domain-containing protein n=1 Tax=Opisthorchis felineus TaxID=147828 RepID=A0A4S2L8S2_OPIFE|nr:hypothetical protein CRM22_009172 [Opisthorchis felineus]
MWRTLFLRSWQRVVASVNVNFRLGPTGPRIVWFGKYSKGSSFETPTATTQSSRTSNYLASPILPLIAALSWPVINLKNKDDVEAETKELFNNALRSAWASDFVSAERTLKKLIRHLRIAYFKHLLSDVEYLQQRSRVSAELANVSLALGKLSTAEKLFKEVIRNVTAAGIPTDDAMVVELSLKLALVYQKMSRLEDAASGFLYCIKTQESRFTSGNIEDADQRSNEQALLGMCHNYYSKFLFENGESEKALEHAKKALELANKLYAGDHFNCLHLLCDVSVLLIDLNKFSEARACLEHAEKLVRARLTQDSTDVDGVQSCLAHILLQRVALEAQDGQVIMAKTYANEVNKVASLLHSPQTVLKQLKDYRKRYNLDVQ